VGFDRAAFDVRGKLQVAVVHRLPLGLFCLLSKTGRSKKSQSKNEKESQVLQCRRHSYILLLRLQVLLEVAANGFLHIGKAFLRKVVALSRQDN